MSVFDGFSLAVLAATLLGVGGLLYYFMNGSEQARRDNARLRNLRQ